MKESIILLKAIKRGCYSDNPDERSSKGGFLMRAGATYDYFSEPKYNNGKGYYRCGTDIIMEEDVDWTRFCKESEYNEIIDKVRGHILEYKQKI